MMIKTNGLLMAALLMTASATAFAQDGEAPPVEEMNGAAPTGAPGVEGMRFRFGVSGGGGLMVWDGPVLKYGGLDLRFGLQVNQLVGIYVQPQLGFYGGEFGGVTGVGGIIGGSVLADFTFADHLFAGAGAGFAVLNNPSGFELHVRAGGYPLASTGGENGRRKGLMLGVDMRVHFVSGATFVAPTLCIGYEAF